MARSTFVRLFALAALVVGGVAVWTHLGFRNWEWRQRLVIELETPNGLVSGGSVVAVQARSSPKWLPFSGAGGMQSATTGEASIIEVRPGQYLFALLGNERELALTLFFPESAPSTAERAKLLETLRETREVPRTRYPLLVTFIDINDPKTIQRVDPDNLAAVFGPAVSMKRVTLEITDENVTGSEIEKLLPWWSSFQNKQLDGDRYWTNKSRYPFANSLNRLDFKRG